MATVRAYWETPNALHWQLDVLFREDAARNRKDNAPANIAILRRRTPSLRAGTHPRARSRSNSSGRAGAMRFFQTFSDS